MSGKCTCRELGGCSCVSIPLGKTVRRRTRLPLGSTAVEELYALMRDLGNACPNDTDGDGDCWICVRNPKAHWKFILDTVRDAL